jgi:hypothetical protein
MERSPQEEKARIQVEFTAMHTNAPILTKSVIPIKINSAHAIAQYKVHASYSKFYAKAGKSIER